MLKCFKIVLILLLKLPQIVSFMHRFKQLFWEDPRPSARFSFWHWHFINLFTYLCTYLPTAVSSLSSAFVSHLLTVFLQRIFIKRGWWHLMFRHKVHVTAGHNVHSTVCCWHEVFLSLLVVPCKCTWWARRTRESSLRVTQCKYVVCIMS